MKPTADQRFDEKWIPVTETGCWIWLAGTNGHGYGTFWFEGRDIGAHRFSYRRTHGAVPAGMVLDHFVCDQRLCVNPDHVRPDTNWGNVSRSATNPVALNLRKTHCPSGHPYDSANTRVRRDGGRVCRACEVVRWPISNARRWASRPR